MLCHQGGEDDEVCPWPTTWEAPPESVREHMRGLSLNFHWEQQNMGGTFASMIGTRSRQGRGCKCSFCHCQGGHRCPRGAQTQGSPQNTSQTRAGVFVVWFQTTLTHLKHPSLKVMQQVWVRMVAKSLAGYTKPLTGFRSHILVIRQNLSRFWKAPICI